MYSFIQRESVDIAVTGIEVCWRKWDSIAGSVRKLLEEGPTQWS